MKKLRSDCLITTDKYGRKSSVRKIIPLKPCTDVSVPMCTCCNVPMSMRLKSNPVVCSAPLSSFDNKHRRAFSTLSCKTASLNVYTYGPIDMEGFDVDIVDMVDYKNKYGV